MDEPLPRSSTGRRPARRATMPRLSPCSTRPAIRCDCSMPRCGCHGNPARYSSGLSLRKSSKSRNGSNSFGSPKPKARCNLTPAPSSVGLGRRTRLTGRMDMAAVYSAPCETRRSLACWCGRCSSEDWVATSTARSVRAGQSGSDKGQAISSHPQRLRSRYVTALNQ